MSELPSGWCTVRLEELCEWCSGGTPRRSEASYFGGEHPWITISDLNDGIVATTAEHLTEAGIANSAAKLVPEGTVLVALYGSIGKLGITMRPSATNQAIACALPNTQRLDSRYLFHYLRSRRHELALQGTGVTQKNIYLGDIKAFAAPVAPRAEQTRIVEKLEELLSDLDAGVAELKAAQHKLARYRQSLLKAAVQGELTAAWRAQHPPQESGAQLLDRILAERRARWEARQRAKFAQQGKTPPKGWQKKYSEPKPPDTAGLPDLPQGWVWSSLGECFQVAVGATPSRKTPDYWNGSIPWVSSGEVRFSRIRGTKETISEAGLNNSSTQINPAGSVLLGMIGEGKTRGQVAILDVPAANNQNCAAIWVGETPVAPEYVYCWLWSQYEQTRRGSSGNNQPALNKSIVERITIPLPPLAEINEIALVVERTLAEIDQQEAVIQHALRQSTAQRQNLLRAAFSGQLVPQNPADEPASALLARIRAERAAQGTARKPRGRSKKEAA